MSVQRARLVLPEPPAPFVDPTYLMDGGTTIRTNLERAEMRSDLSALTTQVMLSVAIPLQQYDKVTSITVRTGGTAANTPTNWWFALYDDSATPALLAQTADQTSTAMAADDYITVALQSVVQIERAGIYRVGIMVKASAVPTLVGTALDHAEISTGLTGQALLSATSGSSLTTTAPATVATPTAVVNVPWVAVQ
jgi:hypothetical protein